MRRRKLQQRRIDRLDCRVEDDVFGEQHSEGVETYWYLPSTLLCTYIRFIRQHIATPVNNELFETFALNAVCLS